MKYLKQTLALIFLFLLLAESLKAEQMTTFTRDTIIDLFYKKVTEGDLNEVRKLIESQEVKIEELNKSDNPWVMMSYAALSGNRDLFDYLLTKGGDVKLADNSGETALHWTAWMGSLEASKWLMEKGADVEAYYSANGGLTPLVCAAESGNLELVEYLVSQGANPLFEDKESGSSPLRGAAYKGNYNVFKYFAELQPKTYDWQSVMLYGILGNSPEIVKYAVEQHGANVNKKTGYWGLPIHEAVKTRLNEEEKSVEIIKYLQSKGARLKDVNDGAIFPWALDNCSEAVIAYLLDQGIKPDFESNAQGWDPLALALDKSSFALAKSLLGTNKEPAFRKMPLIVFFADGLYNSPDIIDFLIKNGINKSHYNEAFLRSAQRTDLKSVKLLLDAGADINYKDNKGLNALYYSQGIELSNYLVEQGIDLTNKDVLELSYTNFVLLRVLIDNGIELSISQENLDSGLCKAALLGDTEIVEFFLQKGADVNAGTETALMQNAKQGYTQCSYSRDGVVQISSDIAKLLIDAGADVNRQDESGQAALHYVSGNQYCRIGLKPIPMGSRLDRQMGFHGDPAVPPKQYHDKILSLLLQRGANPNIQDNDGNTPLILAVIAGNTAAFKLLCAAGADLSLKNNEDKSALDYMADISLLGEIKEIGLLDRISPELIQNMFEKVYYDDRYNEGAIEKIKILISCGVDLNKPFDNYDKSTFLMNILSASYYSDRKQMVQFLLENGADIKAKDERGRTALFYAVKNMDIDMEDIEHLISQGADVNASDNYHAKPYMIAAFNDNDSLVGLLEKYGSTPDYEAEWWYGINENFHTAMVRLPSLLAKGVDINLKAAYPVEPRSSHGINKGMTLLMFLAKLGSVDYIKTVLALGADVNIRDDEGRTALSYAMKNHYGNEKNEAAKILKVAGGIE